LKVLGALAAHHVLVVQDFGDALECLLDVGLLDEQVVVPKAWDNANRRAKRSERTTKVRRPSAGTLREHAGCSNSPYLRSALEMLAW
jgi:hypothetical protein